MKLLPLENYLLSNNISHPKIQPILLSRFKSIDYEILDKLERSRIYDTSDLDLISDDQLLHIGLSKQESVVLRDDISKESKRFSKLPYRLLDLPVNYGFIFYAYDGKNVLNFELFWRGLNFWWAVNADKIDTFLLEFLNFLQSIGLPELISFTDKLPELDVLELPIFDLSIYIGNVTSKQTTDELRETLQIKNTSGSPFKFDETLVLTYIFDFCFKISVSD